MATKATYPVLGCFCLTLCVSGPALAKEKLTFTPKGSAQGEAKPESCEIVEFQDSKPDRPYVTVGTINFHDERHRSNAGSLKVEVAMPKIKGRACKAGADALIDIRVTEVRRLESAMFNVRATAIRFTPD